MRAFLVVNCQSALVWLALRSCSQAAISSMRVCLSGMRRARHWDVRTPSSDSAKSSQLPCRSVDAMGQAARVSPSALFNKPTEHPMSQPFDASKSLATLEQDNTVIAVIEMSQSKWLVAAGGSRGEKPAPHKRPGRRGRQT